MTIASAIDDVIIAQGGTPDPTDTIADSLVNLAGVLAGETIDKTETIEGAVRILGEHIGGGGGGVSSMADTVGVVANEGGNVDMYVSASQDMSDIFILTPALAAVSVADGMYCGFAHPDGTTATVSLMLDGEVVSQVTTTEVSVEYSSAPLAVFKVENQESDEYYYLITLSS